MSDHDAETPRVEPRRSGISPVWLMPILAIGVAGWVVYQNYADQGPLVTVRFPAANGIQAETTELRFLDVKVGVVEDLTFSDDLGAVEAHIRLDQKVAPYVDEEAEFWLVEPQVSARGISGLGTVLSGVYIEGNWDNVPGAAASAFKARANPPLTKGGEDGTRIVLRARAGGQLAAGAPVLFNGIEVGRIGSPVLSDSGAVVTMEAFIAAPHDERLTTHARFWDASGLSLNVGATGLSVSVGSLAALIEGGVTFGTPVAGGQAVQEGYVYEIFANEADARADAFSGDLGPRIQVSALLAEDVTGLAAGTKVRFQGVVVGEVVDFSGVVDPEAGTQLRVDLELSVSELGLATEDPQAALAELVSGGLRLQLGNEGFFGRSMVLDLVNAPDADPAQIEQDEQGRFLLPVIKAALSEDESGLQSLMTRIQTLPVEDLLDTATEALAGIAGLVATPDAQTIPENANALLYEARALVGSDSLRQLLANADGTLVELRQGKVVENLNKILDSANGTLSSVGDAADALPEVTARLNQAVGALQGVVSGYASDSRFYGDLRETLREFTSAAEAFRSLARTIERNPNSLLTGR